MKKLYRKYAVRFLFDFSLILVGIVLFVMYVMKVMPAGWETSKNIGTIAIMWTYGGFFISAGLMLLGVTDIIEVNDRIKRAARKTRRMR